MQIVQPATASQHLGLSVAGARGQITQVAGSEFYPLEWNSKGPESNLEGGATRGGIVTLTGCRGTKPPYRVLRRGFTADILGLSQLVMR